MLFLYYVSALGCVLINIDFPSHNKQCVYLSIGVEATFQPKNSYADATFHFDLFYDSNELLTM